MKKALLLIGVVAISAITFSSCSKTCVCKETTTNVVIFSEEMSKSDCDLQSDIMEIAPNVKCTAE